ncbi:MAG: rod shape-determining protein RodA [Deltaproteobacteria bacterium]|nr:rod shape-determining protein RodA [Deltaproteobacteria bacterium]
MENRLFIKGHSITPYLWVMLGSAVCIVVIGLINLRNTDFYSHSSYVQSQTLWVLVGTILAAITAAVDMRVFEKLSSFFFWLMLFLLLLTLLAGKEVNNSRRWLVFLGVTIQPSEFMKIAFILYLAGYFHGAKKFEKYTLRNLLRPIAYILLPVTLILLQPDLGTTLVIIAVAFSIIFFEGIKWRSFAQLIGAVLFVIPLAWQFDIILPYQKDRIELWLDPAGYKWDVQKKKRVDRSMQPEQALWAVGSGKALGKGDKKGSQSRLKFLPEMHTDFIAATYAEERGFFGMAALILLYFLLIFSAIRIGMNSRERFGVVVSIGITAMIFWQFFINLSMVTGLLPVVGITIPLMSYGGSSIVTVLIGIGLLTNVAIHRGQV